MKTLVVYFSAESGTTRRAAEKLAENIHADLFEIVPEKPYTAADLRYTNPLARCNREFFGKKNVAVIGTVDHFEDYDTVLIGFPIWYGCAPNVINTFCKAYDWTDKKIGLFATSGGSGIGKTQEKLQPYIRGAEILSAVRFDADDAEGMKKWAESLQK